MAGDAGKGASGLETFVAAVNAQRPGRFPWVRVRSIWREACRAEKRSAFRRLSCGIEGGGWRFAYLLRQMARLQPHTRGRWY
jgi:hypothetical protein